MALDSQHADRALRFARDLSFPRYPGTEGDRRAIRMVTDGLREAGLEVAVEEFTYDVRPAFRALSAVCLTSAALTAASALLASTLLGSTVLGNTVLGSPSALLALVLLGAGMAVGIAVLVWAPWAERIYQNEGPTKTANVYGRRPARGTPRMTLILLAHHDSKSQNLTFPFRMGFTLLSIAGVTTLAAVLLTALIRGVEPGPQWLVLGSGLSAALALVVLSTLRSGDKSPGGVDNAGSVGIVLELARILPSRIAADVELVFLSPGAEEDHLIGAMRWLDAHLDELRGRQVYALNFDGVGSPGRLVFLTRYGFGRRFAPRLAVIARRVAKELGFRVRNVMMPPAMGIDSIPFAHRGLECLSLSSGSLGRATIAIHSAGDVADHLDRDTMADALALATAVAEAASRTPVPS